LRRLVATHGSGQPPFATSRDLYRELKAATPPEYHYLLQDLLETITLWHLRTTATAAEPAGKDAWRVTLDVEAQKFRADGSGKETGGREGVMLAIFLVLELSVASVASSAQSFYDSGSRAIAHGDAKRASNEFSRAVALAPNVAQYHERLAYAYSQMALAGGIFERFSLVNKAKAEWQRAVQLDPGLIAARQSLIELNVLAPALMGGSAEEAMEHAREIRKRDPIEGARPFARIHIAAQRLDLARTEYVEMLKTHARSARAHYAYGVFLMLTEKSYALARSQLEMALELEPSYAPAQFRIGQAAALSGDSPSRGEEALKQYLK
jgi:tetratricopeptide (TPR) repeat protein